MTWSDYKLLILNRRKWQKRGIQMTIEDDLLIQKRFDRLERLEEANETIGETSEIYIANVGISQTRGV